MDAYVEHLLRLDLGVREWLSVMSGLSSSVIDGLWQLCYHLRGLVFCGNAEDVRCRRLHLSLSVQGLTELVAFYLVSSY